MSFLTWIILGLVAVFMRYAGLYETAWDGSPERVRFLKTWRDRIRQKLR